MPVKWQDFIEQRSDVMLGKPVFKGTRLTVEHILRDLGAGLTQDELLVGYPQLSADHLKAALLYSAAVLGMDETIYA